MRPRDKLKPLDYAVMFGGPIAFLLIFWFGVRAVMGPIPEANPVKKLREGVVKIGDPLDKVNKELGRANDIVELPDGGFRMVYTRTVFDETTRSDSLDEAVVEVSPTGRVIRITFDRSEPPRPSQ